MRNLVGGVAGPAEACNGARVGVLGDVGAGQRAGGSDQALGEDEDAGARLNALAVVAQAGGEVLCDPRTVPTLRRQVQQ